MPIRTCIATGEKRAKNELMRFVLTKEGKIFVDPKDQLKGRGANLSMNIEAFELAIKKRALERALKLKAQLTTEEIEKLRKDFIEGIEERNFRKGNQAVTIKVTQEEFEKVTKE
jgi:predicted RNA-binding protein YlxR (DUF448 family)